MPIPEARIVGRIDIDGTVWVLPVTHRENPVGKENSKLLSLVERKGRVSYLNFLTSFSYCMSAKVLQERLEGLVQGGQLRREIEGRNVWYIIGGSEARLVESGGLASIASKAGSVDSGGLVPISGKLSQLDLEKLQTTPIYIANPNLWAYRYRCILVNRSPLDDDMRVHLAIKNLVLDAESEQERLEQEVNKKEKRLLEPSRHKTQVMSIGLVRGLFSHVRNKWLAETPEEIVRQKFVCRLVNEYGYSIEQIAEEVSVTGGGSAQARADIVVWRSVQDRLDGKNPLIVVECKHITDRIHPEDYQQGENYARISGSKYLVLHNNRETQPLPPKGGRFMRD